MAVHWPRVPSEMCNKVHHVPGSAAGENIAITSHGEYGSGSFSPSRVPGCVDVEWPQGVEIFLFYEHYYEVT